MEVRDSLKGFKLFYEIGSDNIFQKIKVVYLSNKIQRSRKDMGKKG